MTLTVRDHFTDTTGTDLNAHSSDVGGSGVSWAKLVGTMIITGAGLARNSTASASVYSNTVPAPASGYRVGATIDAQATLLTGAQTQVVGRLPTTGTNTDSYRLFVKALDTAGNVEISLGRYSTTNVLTNLATYTTTWPASTSKTLVLGLSIANTQIAFVDGVPVLVTFDTTVTRNGRAGIGSGTTLQGSGQGYQATDWWYDDLASAPTASVAPAVTGSAVVGGTLTCSAGTWSGGDTTAYQWMTSTDGGTTFKAIAGATSAAYVVQAGDSGNRLRCVVMRSTGARPSTMENVGTSLTSSSTIATGVPANSVAPVVTGTASVGSLLTTNRGTWSPDATSYADQWQHDLGAGFVDIAGATGQTYTVVSGDVTTTGSSIRCRTTGINGSGPSVSPASSNSIVLPAIPVNTTPPHIFDDGSPASGEVLTVSDGVWTPGSPSPDFTYQWYRGASPIIGAVNNTYTIAVSDEGANITCRVKGTNGGAPSGVEVVSDNTVVPAVTAAISDASFLVYLTGGSGNTNPALSLGGARGGTYAGGLNVLLGPILGSVAQGGGQFFIDVVMRNTHTISTAAGLKLYIEQQFVSDHLHIAAAVPVEAANVNAPLRSSLTEAPTGVTWITTTDPAAGAAFGDLTPGSWRHIHLRFTIDAGTPVTEEDDWGVAVQGLAA